MRNEYLRPLTPLLLLLGAFTARSSSIAIESVKVVQASADIVSWYGSQASNALALKVLPNGYLIGDMGNHRLVNITPTGTPISTLGSIGQKTGEFFEMRELTVGRNQEVYVLDAAGKRLQVFSNTGTLLSHVVLPNTVSGLCVNNQGETLLGDPASGHLVSVYSRGGVLVRQFGTLKRASELYGGVPAKMSDVARPAMNRTRLVCDRKGNTYLAFLSAPVIQKYGPNNVLLFEKWIGGERAETLIREFLQRGKAPIGLYFRGDDSYAPYVTAGLTIDEDAGVLYVALQWHKLWIHVADVRGTPSAEIEVQYPSERKGTLPMTFNVEFDRPHQRLLGMLGDVLWAIGLHEKRE